MKNAEALGTYEAAHRANNTAGFEHVDAHVIRSVEEATWRDEGYSCINKKGGWRAVRAVTC